MPIPTQLSTGSKENPIYSYMKVSPVSQDVLSRLKKRWGLPDVYIEGLHFPTQGSWHNNLFYETREALRYGPDHNNFMVKSLCFAGQTEASFIIPNVANVVVKSRKPSSLKDRVVTGFCLSKDFFQKVALTGNGLVVRCFGEIGCLPTLEQGNMVNIKIDLLKAKKLNPANHLRIFYLTNLFNTEPYLPHNERTIRTRNLVRETKNVSILHFFSY